MIFIVSGVSDCADQSDERHCNIVEYPDTRHYETSLPPISRDESGEVRAVEVEVGVDILNIAGVQETRLQWSVKLELELVWRDERLRWRHLRQDNNLNIIPLQAILFTRSTKINYHIILTNCM